MDRRRPYRACPCLFENISCTALLFSPELMTNVPFIDGWVPDLLRGSGGHGCFAGGSVDAIVAPALYSSILEAGPAMALHVENSSNSCSYSSSGCNDIFTWSLCVAPRLLFHTAEELLMTLAKSTRT